MMESRCLVVVVLCRQAAKAYFVGLCVVGTLWIALRVIWAIRTVAAVRLTASHTPSHEKRGEWV